MKRAVVLVALASCGRFGFTPIDPLSGDDGGASGDDGAATGDSSGSNATCVDPGNGCAFNGATPCSCWGTPQMILATMNETGGHLSITPNANQAGAQGSCSKNGVPFGPEGVIIEVSSVVAGAQGLTALQIGGGTDTFEIDIQNGMFKTTDGSNTNSNTYDPVAMRWWRIRPVAAGTEFDVSPDGKNWSTRTTSGHTASTTYSMKIIGGTIGGVAAPGSAVIEGINICPP